MTVSASVSRVERVGFSSGSSGTGPATWGQQAIWDAVSKLGVDSYRYNVCIGFPVQPGIPVPRVLAAVARLTGLYESLRTRLEPDGSGGLRQILDAAGTTPVHLRESDADQAERRGRELLAELETVPFDCAAEWPMRIAVVETGGLMTFVGFCLSHTAVDGWGLSRVVTDLFALANGDSPEQVGSGTRGGNRWRRPPSRPRTGDGGGTPTPGSPGPRSCGSAPNGSSRQLSQGRPPLPSPTRCSTRRRWPARWSRSPPDTGPAAPRCCWRRPR